MTGQPHFPWPYFPLSFGADGTPLKPEESEQLMDALTSESSTDLLLLAHGWNDDRPEAEELYSRLAASVASFEGATPRRIILAGVHWPSKKFGGENHGKGGAASLHDPQLRMQRRFAEFRELAAGGGSDAAVLDDLESMLSAWPNSRSVRLEVVEAVRSLLPGDAAEADDASERFLRLKPEALLERIADTPAPGVPNGPAGLRSWLRGAGPALLNLLNYSTFYLMKSRAGTVGGTGLAPLLTMLLSKPGVRVHLAGHSFGARLLSSALLALPGGLVLRPLSLTLLQAAFSHFGFAERWNGRTDGAFRRILTDRSVDGPILITHTRNDAALASAYPVASRIAGQVASVLGGTKDTYGGLGTNGALKTPEAVAGRLLAAGKPWSFAAGSLWNLRSDAFIRSHSDVAGPEVGWLLSRVMGR